METSKQPSLNRDFHLLNFAQFLGAFNDNVFKFFLIFALVQIQGKENMPLINQLAGAIFVLPFLLFASSAGYLAGRFSKQRIVQHIKLIELGVMVAGSVAFYWQSVIGLYAVLFLMAAQSAFFGPAKYGILPEILPTASLSKANGWQQAFVYIAIVLGAGVVPVLSRFTDGRYHLASIFCIGLALLGWILARGIRTTEVSGTTQRWHLNPLTGVRETFRAIQDDTPLLSAIIGVAFFLLIGGFVQMNLIPYGVSYMGFEQVEDASLLFLIVAVGIGTGAMAAGMVSGRQIEFGLVPLGALGLALTLGLLGAKVGAGSFLATGSILIIMGVSGGLYIVPLVAFVQWHSPRERLTEILALESFLSFLGVLLAALLLMGMTDLDISPSGCFLAISLLTLGLVLLAFRTLPDFLIRFVGAVVLRCIYRIRTSGLENLPTHGPALLVCNHVTYVDAPLILSVQARRVRFLVYRDYYENPWLHPLLKLMNCIPISENDPPRQIMQSIQSARAALEAGYLVCIFAEGRLTRSGLMNAFRPGYQKITKGMEVPIIPVFLGGAWGSLFSRAGRGRYRHHRIKLPYPISLHFGKPMPSNSAVHEVRQAVQELGGDHHTLESAAKGSLAIQMVRMSRRYWNRPFMSDTTGKRLTFGRSLIGALLLRERLRLALGHDKQSAVGILLPSCVGGAIVNMALTLDGRTTVNLNFTASPQAFASALEQSGIETTITSRAFLEKIPAYPLSSKVIYMEDLSGEVSTQKKLTHALAARCLPIRSLLPPSAMDGSQTATILFSSGSTAEPKGIQLTHHNLISNVFSAAEVIPLGDEDGLSAALPFFHSFGLTATIWLPLLNGVRVHYHTNPLDASQMAQMVREESSTILFATPTFLMAYIRKARPQDFRSLRLIVTGAEKLKTKLADMFEKKFGVRPLEGYGTTELSPIVSLNLPAPPALDPDTYTHKDGSVGHPIPGVSARIVDPESRVPLPPHQDGMLLIKGPNVMRGYLGEPSKTEKVLQEGWYETGDIAKLDDDGFIVITGRLSRFSKIGGEMVPHEAIEQVLMEDGREHAAPFVAVTSVPCDRKGERLIVLHTADLGDLEETLQRLKQADIPNLWKPNASAFYQVESIPLLGSGKLDLKGIRSSAESLSREA